MRYPMNYGTIPARAIVAAAFLAGSTAIAAASTPAPIQGWQALAGCWAPVAAARDSAPAQTRGHLVCVIPIEGTSAAEFVTIVDGKAASRERVDASGARQPLTRDDCSGWQSAEWSATGHRLYLRSELTCAGGAKRTSTGVISMPISSEWVDVQSVAVGESRAARALRYREIGSYAAVPAAESNLLAPRAFSMATTTARLAASAPVMPVDIVDVARNLDASAAELWLAEQQLGFKADAGRLVQLADAGVPGSMIDMVVALSYPEQFTVATVEPRVDNQMVDRRYGVGGGYYDPFWDPYYGSRYDRRYYSPYGYSRYGSGAYYGSGYYGGGYYGRPVVVVVTPTASDTVSRGGGRVVKGRGYTRRAEPSSTPTQDRDRSTRSGGSSGSSGSSAGSSSTGSGGSSSTGSSSGGSSSGGSSGERTAKRRPPPSGN